ncbi:MAG: metallophosphoesterase [Marinilabiliaceae bacterium]|nr:metallophosphoesterase [Marinilabiliaceae bacterium]
MTNTNPLHLYSTKQIVITTALAGPLMGGYMLQRNFKNMNRQRASVVTSLLSYLLQAITYFVFIVATEVIVIRSGLYTYSHSLGFVAVIGTLLLLQLFNSGLVVLSSRSSGIETTEKHLRYYPMLNMIFTILAGVVITFFLVRSGPFWFRFLSVYFLASFYLYHRLAKPFAKEWQRLLVMGIGFLLTCMYPAIQFINDYIDIQYIKTFQLFGYNYLAFMLYFFLLFIVLDVTITIIDRTRFRHKDKSVLNVSRVALSVGLTLLVSGIVAGGIHQFNTPKVNKYVIGIPAKTSPLKELKIAMAADLHISELTKRAFIHQFVKEINALEADIVLIPGDIVETGAQNEAMTYMSGQLAQIKSKYGTFAVLGNHDYGNVENKKAFLQAANMTLLTDTTLVIDDSFVLIGRQDRRRYRKSLDTILETPTDVLPWIMMDHRPPDMKAIAAAGINLSVSGHTHHGQLFPFNYITERIYDLSWGYQQQDQTHVFVTCGAQGWGPTVRVGSQSEIMEILVKFEN